MAAPRPLYLRQLDYRVGPHTLIQGVDLTLFPGELCALIGPSGAGKSTLLRLMLGLLEPTQGSVRLGPQRVQAHLGVGYVPQDDALHAALTVQQSLDFALRLRLSGLDGEKRRRAVSRLIVATGLDGREHLPIGRLSGGQRKRVSVAMELASSPALLVLDEPTSGLDPGLEEQLMTLFRQVASGGRVVLVATHAMQSLDLCHQLLIIQAGRLVWFGPPVEALGYFGVARHEEIFRYLASTDAATSAARYRASGWPQRMAQRQPGAACEPAGDMGGESNPVPAPTGEQPPGRDAAAILARLRARRAGEEDGDA